MRLTNPREILTPITVKQATLKRFFPQLPEGPKPGVLQAIDAAGRLSAPGAYTLELVAGDVVEIVETHCLACGARLSHNGYYRGRRLVLPHLGEVRVDLHRKYCPRCKASIKMDLSRIVPPGGQYHANFPRAARQLITAGFTPRQVRDAFEVLWDVAVPHSTVAGWIDALAPALRDLLAGTPVPSSGLWGYDEIFLKIRGARWYALVVVDLVTGFVVAMRVREHMGRADGRVVLAEARRGGRHHGGCKVDALVKDGTTNLGGLLHTASFKHVKTQRCLVHLKKTAARHVKALAGFSKHSQKPLPAEWVPFRRQVYRALEAKDETEFFCAVAHVQGIFQRPLPKKRLKKFSRFLRTVVAARERILACRRDPRLPATNNRVENSHQRFEAYPSFKTRMMTARGAQRAGDYQALARNLRCFPAAIARVERKLAQVKGFCTGGLWDPTLNGAQRSLRARIRHYRESFGKYQEFWGAHLAKI